MKSTDIQEQIDKLEAEIVSLKAEVYDRLEAIKHLEAVKAAMGDEENTEAG